MTDFKGYKAVIVSISVFVLLFVILLVTAPKDLEASFAAPEINNPIEEVEPDTDGKFLTFDEKYRIDGRDFPDDSGGTIEFFVDIEKGVFLENNPEIPRYISFFESKSITGLAVSFDLADDRILAGLPLMKSKRIILDGELHQIVYSFQKAGEQAVFFDGELVAASEYKGSNANAITGMAVSDLSSAKKLKTDTMFYNAVIK